MDATIKPIWEEPGGQRMFAVLTDNNQRVILTEQYYPPPEDAPVLFYLNERHKVLVIRREENGLIKIFVETIRHGKLQGPCDFPISPALAAHLVERWGYRVRFETKGIHFRTGVDGCVRAIPTASRTGRV